MSKISGTVTEESKIYIIDEATNTLESAEVHPAGDYEITGLTFSEKIIAAVRTSNKASTTFANVTPIYVVEPTYLSSSYLLKSSYISLSNGNLTATRLSGGGAYQNVRTELSVTTGKYYWEMYVNSSIDDNFVGIITPSLSTSAYPTQISQGATWWNWPGWYPSTTAPAPPIWGTGDRLMFAMDLDSNKLWFGKNGTWLSGGNPATGANPSFGSPYTPVLSEVAYGAAVILRGVNSQVTFNFGATTFTYVVPTGFTAGLKQ